MNGCVAFSASDVAAMRKVTAELGALLREASVQKRPVRRDALDAYERAAVTLQRQNRAPTNTTRLNLMTTAQLAAHHGYSIRTAQRRAKAAGAQQIGRTRLIDPNILEEER